MNKTVVIHQPDFLPHPSFFHRLLNADEWISLDNVKMSNGGGWVHRDKIKTPSGGRWITVPIKGIGEGPIIREAEIDHGGQFDKILRVIEANYRAAPYFENLYPGLRNILVKGHTRLCELNMELLHLLIDWFGIEIAIRDGSSFGFCSTKSQLMADMVRSAGGDTYLSGPGAKAYHDDAPFDSAGVRVVWQSYVQPIYPQLHGEFVPGLSCIDMLFNCGIDESRNLLRGIK